MTVTDHRRWHVCVYAMRMPAGGACSLAHTSHNCVCHRGFWRGLGGRRRTVCCRYVQADCNGPVLTQCRHLLESMMPTQPIAIGTAQSDLRVSYSELSGALTRCPSPPSLLRCHGGPVLVGCVGLSEQRSSCTPPSSQRGPSRPPCSLLWTPAAQRRSLNSSSYP